MKRFHRTLFGQVVIALVPLISILFGAAVALLGERGRPVVHLVDSLPHVFFKIIGFIVKLAPPGVLDGRVEIDLRDAEDASYAPGQA